jgi:hypothetical protein
MSPSDTGRRNPNSVASFRTPRPAPGRTGAPATQALLLCKGTTIDLLARAGTYGAECQVHGQLAIVKAATVARALSM